MKPLLPFVTTPDEKLEIIIRFAEVRHGQTSYDMGAGDGRIVIAMAQAGATATGSEIQEKYVRRAKMNIAQAGLTAKAKVTASDFWLEDLSQYDIVTIYGMAMIMEQVAEKLSREVKPGARVISNGFPIPGRKIEKTEDHIYLHLFQ